MPDVTVGSHVDDLMTSADAAAARTAIGAAPLASPTFTGTPAAPTAAGGTSTTQLASTAFVQQELASKSYVDGEVTNYADLPVTVGTPAVGAVYLVKEWSIANPLSFPGAWLRIANDGDLDDWTRMGNEADMFADAYFRIADEGDSSKKIAFNVGGVTAGQTRQLTPLDKNYTMEETSHAAKHQSGGSDAIKLDDLAAAEDNTDLDATGSAHGLMPKADKTKLDGIESGATADQSNAEIETAYNAQVAAASQAEAEAGTEAAIRRWSPLRVAQAIAALGGGGGGAYLLGPFGFTDGGTLSDAVTRYWGGFIANIPSSSADTFILRAPITGTITKAYFFSQANTAGSNEAWELYIRDASATETLIESVSSTSATREWSNTSLGIAVTAGQIVGIKEVRPTWGTNPIGFRIIGFLVIEP